MIFDISEINVPSYKINYDDFEKLSSEGSLSREPEKATERKIKICTWNVNGIRSNILRPCNCQQLKLHNSVVKTFNSSVGLGRIIDKESPDIICLQETKASLENIANIQVEGWDIYASESKRGDKRGPNRYSGTAIFVNRERLGKPTRVINNLPGLPDDMDEGRLVALEFKDFWLVNVYTPNSGSNAEFRNKTWSPLMLSFLDSLDNVILCGDMNVARTLYDIKHKANESVSLEYVDQEYTKKNVAGFRSDERKWFDKLLKTGFTDVWRKMNPESTEHGYTYVDNIGKVFRMRIDYFLTKFNSHPFEITECAVDEYQSRESDHIPLFMTIRI